MVVEKIFDDFLTVREGLTEKEREFILHKLTDINVRKGELIIKEGDVGNSMYFIIDGKVKIFKKHLGKELELAVLEDGDFFGEMALLDEFPRSASVVALADCRLHELSKSDFQEIIEEYPRLGVKIVSSIANELSKRIRLANRRIEDLFFLTEGLIENEKFREFCNLMFK